MAAKITLPIPEWLDRICAWPVMVYRKRRYGYTYRRIYLGEGEWTMLDPEDYYVYGNLKWSVSGRDGKFYAIRGVRAGPKEIKLIGLHREIMNAPAGLLVDHRNRDSLDNRRENLRLATPSQNSYNRQKSKSKTLSQYRGVTFNKRVGKWVARIKYQGKTIWLGYFDNEIDAARAYDAAAKKYYGEFAMLNFAESADSV